MTTTFPRAGLPMATAGLRIGLLGGSFDPAHQGHVAITKAALARFDLDQVWWLVSPGNPLKAHGPAPLDHRLAQARRVMDHPRVKITAIEQHFHTRYTADTLAALRAAYRGVTFVWLMGSDNLAGFHRWDRWREIAAQTPIGILARPESQLAGLASVAARTLADQRLPSRDSRLLGQRGAQWCMVNLPLDNSSSTRLRAAGVWRAR